LLIRKNNFVIYTALFGDYDDLIDPREEYDGCDFICFTNQKHLKSDIWEIRIIEECDLSASMMNRRYKILPHQFLSNYEQSLYVDANIAIIGNPLDLANKYLGEFEIAVPKHFLRDCTYEEANIVIKSKKADEFIVKQQMKFYCDNNFPREYGLSENNIIYRNHNNYNVIMSMQLWWTELNTWANRDQLSFGYVLWKTKIKHKLIVENCRSINSTYFFLFGHKNDSNKIKKSFKYLINRMINL